MTILVDVCLSEDWIPFINRNKIHSVHWSSLGPRNAKDHLIFENARAENLVIFTHDLDFGTLLAHSHAHKPSVIQARVDDITPEALGSAFLTVINSFSGQLEKGAIVTILPDRTRVRILPI